MARTRELLRNLDIPLLAVTLVLVGFGIVMIYSATYGSGAAGVRELYRRQAIWALLSLGVMAGAIALPNKVFNGFAYLIYGFAILLLIVTVFLGLKGRWLAIGPLSFQSSEFAKIATAMALARYLFGRKQLTPGRVMTCFVICLLPMLLVAKQPDLGTSLVFAAILFPVLYQAGLRPLYLFFILTPLINILCAFWWISWGIFIVVLLIVIYLSRPSFATAVFLIALNLGIGIAVPVLWGRLQKYQQERILSFLDPNRDPLGAGYQVIQSKVAIGSGRIFGKGFLQGTQTKLAFLPKQHTDFIFSVVGEELGFLGAMSVLLAFLFVIWRGIRIATSAKNRFASLMAVGLVSIIAFHVFVNTGMAMGILPVTGLPLPFLSYGGSSLMTSMLLVGLLLNVGMRQHEY